MRGLAKVEMGDNVSIHPMAYIEGEGGLTIGNNVSIAHGTSVMTVEHDFAQPGVCTRDAPVRRRHVTVGDDVWVGCGVRVLAGVEIGAGAVVGAGSVVAKHVPSFAVVAGVPARVIRANTKWEPARDEERVNRCKAVSTVRIPVEPEREPGARMRGVSVARAPVRIVIVVAAGKTANLLMHGQLAFLRSHGFEVTVVAAPGAHLRDVARREGVEVLPIKIARTMHPLRDLLTLYKLWRFLRTARPHIVNASTPKAGLLGMLAARLAGVPVRIYTLRGLRLETTEGMQRRVLSACERVASYCAHRIVCVSRSVATQYAAAGLAPAEKTVVLGDGSSNGVDTERFSPASAEPGGASRLRKELGIPTDAFVVGFVGRMTRDKGIADLVEAFEPLSVRCPRMHLIFVGDYEAGNAVDAATRTRIGRHPRMHVTGFVNDTVPFYHLFDVLAFPSYREGFPNVVIEANACGLPVVGFAATGTVDAVLDGWTGQLVAVGDVAALGKAIAAYMVDPSMRARHGAAARQRVTTAFRREAVWESLDRLYKKELERSGSMADPRCDERESAVDLARAA